MSDMVRIGWFCARCGKLVAYGETRPSASEHACESPFKDDKLPYVEFKPTIEPA